MPEFTVEDFCKWLKASILDGERIFDTIRYAYREDNEKAFRALGAFQRWVAKGCKEA